MPSDVVELDPSYRFIFDNPRNGTLDCISKAGCVALAKLGSVSWNAWRRDFPTQGGKLNHGFGTVSKYRNYADFRNHVFEELADFSNFNFGANAEFENAEFRKHAIFDGSTFGEDTNFDLAQFLGGARFQNVKFDGDVSFKCAKFLTLAFFSHSQFSGKLNCIGAVFSGQTNFNNVIFGRSLVFDEAQFLHFSGVTFKGGTWEEFFAPYSSNKVDEIKSWANQRGFHPSQIRNASFEGAIFKSNVDFSNRDFLERTRFSKRTSHSMSIWPERDEEGNLKFSESGQVKELAHFEGKADAPLIFGSPPIFHNCKFNQDISFDGVIFPEASGFEGSVRAYRTLKLAFAQQQAVREEQRFFRLEMAEEAKGESWQKRYLYRTYQLLSDFGFSLWRPLLLLVVTWLIFASAYGALANLSLCLPFQDGCKVIDEWLEFSLLQVLPLAGFGKIEEGLRSQLFATSAASIGVTIAVLLHKSLSLLALFLSGLALRNLFKMK